MFGKGRTWGRCVPRESLLALLSNDMLIGVYEPKFPSSVCIELEALQL